MTIKSVLKQLLASLLGKLFKKVIVPVDGPTPTAPGNGKFTDYYKIIDYCPADSLLNHSDVVYVDSHKTHWFIAPFGTGASVIPPGFTVDHYVA